MSVIPILGFTVHYDEHSGYSRLMLVMVKAKFGNLENQIEKEIPTDYFKPCQLALSITKNIKDLHWNYIHGNVHTRNVLLSNADYIGELVDITFMHLNKDQQSTKPAGRWPYVAPEVAGYLCRLSTDRPNQTTQCIHCLPSIDSIMLEITKYLFP
ncbi:uncharacterized protein B0P05DRAFT_536916 [Gilbertella persicaria]|uniref:uncharacterized protein n=1 Tax=Gilbertella persicaria TaxID=101096 RepID=UPI00221FE370|nr:uncharacterized protein B0P05DRAFT_536916 [Gilbertella persicaria]KAI8083323.1 hypothetical protein B0P05DRAFT_536916 [Gilbertella persicaria]